MLTRSVFRIVYCTVVYCAYILVSAVFVYQYCTYSIPGTAVLLIVVNKTSAELLYNNVQRARQAVADKEEAADQQILLGTAMGTLPGVTINKTGTKRKIWIPYSFDRSRTHSYCKLRHCYY